jgi:outer membrane murein-binding lipoprotein Lpp
MSTSTALPRSHAIRRRPLAAALLVALTLPGMAFAQSAKEIELEARVAELERMVQQLVAEREAAPAQVTAAPAPATPAAATVPVVAQGTPILPSANPGTRFSFGGFVKMDSSITQTNDGDIADGTVGRTFYVPKTIPVGAGATAESGADTDMGVHYSRFWLGTDTDLDGGDRLRSYFELDLYGGGSTAFTGNEAATNTYAVTLRHAYVQWNNWLAGQTWSNFQDAAALPDAVDFVGPTEGTVFVRQAQLRYTNGPFSFSIENPETMLTPYQGGMAAVASDDGAVPDFTARYTAKGDWGHFAIAGLARQLKYQNGPLGISEDGTGFGVSASGKFNVGASDDLRYMVTAGSGIGRYVGLALNNDAVLAEDFGIENIDVVSGFAAWRHVFSPKLRGSLFYSFAEYDNPVELTGLGITRAASSAHANLIYTVLPKLEVGAELIWGKRELENGDSGELNRLQTHVKYSF